MVLNTVHEREATAALLGNGKVVLVGGEINDSGTCSVELCDPAAKTGPRPRTARTLTELPFTRPPCYPTARCW